MIYDIVGEYNNTYHETIKMKLVDVGDDSFAEYNEKFNEHYHVRISKFKMDLLKGMHLIGVKYLLLLKKLKILCLGHMQLVI